MLLTVLKVVKRDSVHKLINFLDRLTCDCNISYYITNV